MHHTGSKPEIPFSGTPAPYTATFGVI